MTNTKAQMSRLQARRAWQQASTAERKAALVRVWGPDEETAERLAQKGINLPGAQYPLGSKFERFCREQGLI